MFRKGIAALAGVGAVAVVGQHLASAPSRIHPLLQAYHRSAAAAASSTQPQHRRSHTSVSVAHLGKEGAAAAVLENPEWPEEWPFTEEDFKRYDETSDLDFYAAPRIVHHIDESSRAALTEFYLQIFSQFKPATAVVLDICSSWVSHYPQHQGQQPLGSLRASKEWV